MHAQSPSRGLGHTTPTQPPVWNTTHRGGRHRSGDRPASVGVPIAATAGRHAVGRAPAAELVVNLHRLTQVQVPILPPGHKTTITRRPRPLRPIRGRLLRDFARSMGTHTASTGGQFVALSPPDAHATERPVRESGWPFIVPDGAESLPAGVAAAHGRSVRSSTTPGQACERTGLEQGWGPPAASTDRADRTVLRLRPRCEPVSRRADGASGQPFASLRLRWPATSWSHHGTLANPLDGVSRAGDRQHVLGRCRRSPCKQNGPCRSTESSRSQRAIPLAWPM